MSEIAIVGAGPVGLICALALGKAGHQVKIIESAAGIVNSPRAMGYHWPVLSGLAYLGLLDDMEADGFRVSEISFRVLASGEDVRYPASVLAGETDHPYMLVLGQNRLAAIVLRHLEKLPNVEIIWKTQFRSLLQDSECVAITAERGGRELKFSADWLIGADGGRSAVRKSLGMEFSGFTWPDRFVATNIRYDFDKFGWGSMGFLLDPETPAVVGRLDRDNLWRVTFRESIDLPIDGLDQRIPEFLKRVLPGEKSYELELFSGYQMHQRSAASYRDGRVLLAGDAAHITNPTSGFGLVGGLFDAFTLCEALNAVTHGADDRLLDDYSEARRRVFEEVTSPVSSRSFKLIFHAKTAEAQRTSLADIRRRAADPRLVREWYATPARLESPSLLTGQTLRERQSAALANAGN